jgi:hypothetical protein
MNSGVVADQAGVGAAFNVGELRKILCPLAPVRALKLLLPPS